MKKQITRRELLKEMLSKDTIKQVACAWYGFSTPLLPQNAPVEPKKESLAEKVRRLNQMNQTKETNTKLYPNGKEG